MRRAIFLIIFIFTLSGLGYKSQAQTAAGPSYGPKDTLIVPSVFYDGAWIPYGEMEMVYIANVPPDKLAKLLEAYNRLRNAVYVTYPYARTAGAVINDVNAHLQGVTG